MGGLSGPYVPDTEEERDFMEDLAMALRRAERHGLPRKDMSRILAFQASAVLDPAVDHYDADDERETLADRLNEDDDDSVCPECGGEVEGYHAEMGEPLEVKPCGCEVTDMDWIEKQGWT